MAQIKKEQMIAGTKLKIRPVIKDGIPSLGEGIPGSGVIPYVRMFATAGSFFDGYLPINSGDVVEVVDGPKRRGGINTIIVKDATGVEGHVYWCEMRASADIDTMVK